MMKFLGRHVCYAVQTNLLLITARKERDASNCCLLLWQQPLKCDVKCQLNGGGKNETSSAKLYSTVSIAPKRELIRIGRELHIQQQLQALEKWIIPYFPLQHALCCSGVFVFPPKHKSRRAILCVLLCALVAACVLVFW